MLCLEIILSLFPNPTMKMNLVTVMATLATVTAIATAVTNMEMTCQPLSLIGATQKKMILMWKTWLFQMMNQTCGDAVASFSFASPVNALLEPSDDDNKVINDSVTIESVVTVESLDMPWFDTYSVGDLSRRALISFFPQAV
jgi:hypothetical protein